MWRAAWSLYCTHASATPYSTHASATAVWSSFEWPLDYLSFQRAD